MLRPALFLDIALLKNYLVDSDLVAVQTHVTPVYKSLIQRTCAGRDFLGWLDLPWSIESELDRLRDMAAEIQDNADHLVSIGIGGSYLGARAAIDFLADPFLGNDKVIFFGHHLSSDYAESLLDYVMQKNVYVNVISKSGTTTEPAISFRLLRQTLSRKYSQDELARRIISTTDQNSGILREITNAAGYRSFIIKESIGGRFSVLSPVGLLPIAVAGYDIEAIVAGAQDMATVCLNQAEVLENNALKYAVARYLLYQKGKNVEIFSGFEASIHFIAEWWKQLFGESEGKEHKGIYPTAAILTTDLHSLGQFMQEGSRMMFETFLTIEKSRTDIHIPCIDSDDDKLNFVAGRTMDFLNQQAYIGTKYAHFDGDLPNMTVALTERSEYALGQLFYFFEFAVAVSGLLVGVNPFNQPGVEAYKQNMFALLGKDGYEERKTALEKQIMGK